MKKDKKAHLIKGSIQYDGKPIKKDWLMEKFISKDFKQLLDGKGVYILYKKRGKKYEIVYIGIAGFGRQTTLFNRLKHHTRGNLKRKWDYFTAFIIPVSEKNKRFLKDIEGVLIRAISPSLNKIRPNILEERNYQRKVKRIVRQQVREIKIKGKEFTEEQRTEEEKLKNKYKKIQKQHKQEEEKYKNLLNY